MIDTSMMIPFGFSFGDFVAGIALLKSLIDALNGTFGAKAEYRGLISQLYCLERALVAIKELEVQEDSREYEATQQAVRGCRECIDRFISKTASYQSLTAGKSSIRDQVRKISWAKCRKEDLNKFKEDLNIYVSSINILLNTLQLSQSKKASLATKTSVETQIDVLRQVEDLIKRSDLSHNESLQRIERLLQIPKAQNLGAASTFLVRPLRLIDAPIAPNFVPRSRILHDMEEYLLPLSPNRQKILVLSGPGGIGKSQMARSYATQHQNDYESLFWIDGRSEQSLRMSLARIAELIPLPRVLNFENKIPKAEGDINKAILAVESWFTSVGNSRWLVIIDNVDTQSAEEEEKEEEEEEEGVFQAVSGYDVARYIPSVAQGAVIVTSRLSFLASNLGAKNISIAEMNLEEALQVLHIASSRPYNERGARELVSKLGAYPLALMQAARYIYENHTTAETYLARYNRDRRLLVGQNLSKREYHKRSIDATLQLSLEELKARDPMAVAFLRLCGFLDNKDIFWEFLNVAYKFANPVKPEAGVILSFDDPSSIPFSDLDPGWIDKICSNEAIFDATVKSLCEFSFIQWNEGSDGFAIHSVIHEWIASYRDPDSTSKLLALAAKIVAANYGAQSEIPSQRIQPHVGRCVGLANPSYDYPKWSFDSLFLLGAFYYDNRDVISARQLISFALDQVVFTFGHDSEITALWDMRISPMLMQSQSIDSIVQKLILGKAILTSQSVSSRRINQNRIDVGNHLCYAYQMQGDFKKAIKVGEEIVDITMSGQVDLMFVCCAMGLLAESYLACGNYSSAKSYASKAFRQHELIFSPDPKDSSLSNWRRRNMTIMAIAATYLGEFELAEVVLASVHIEAVRYHGPDERLTIHAKNNLGCLHKIRAWREQNVMEQSDGSILSNQREAFSRNPVLKSSLQELSTDRHIIYLRFDLAMGLFDTLGFVIDGVIRKRKKNQTRMASRQSW